MMNELREALQPYAAVIVGVPLMLFIFIDSWVRERRFLRLFGRTLPKACWKHQWHIGYGFDPTNDRQEHVPHRVCARCMKLEYRIPKSCKWRDCEKAIADREKYQIRMEKYWRIIERRRERVKQHKDNP